MVAYWQNLTFCFVKENVKNGIYRVFFWRKKWLTLGQCGTYHYNFCMTA